MSTETENQPVPNWLLKLEEQRERRLKVKLGHEADAGAKCQKCEDKCPGLDLHFWRKICKVCKCSKEDHDILDDDIYGYVQFQLLGSKPVKSKGAFLKGHKDEVILEWTPKGSSNDVKKYLDELPPEMVPVKGSEGAKIRKQRLQKQMPAHDIDSSLCHQLSEGEIKEMEEYVAHIRKNCVGQGKIIRLSLLKGSPHKINPSSPQFLSQGHSVQIASSQTVFLQSSDLSNNLNNLSLREQNSDSLVKPPKAVLPTYTPQTVNPSVDNQSPSYYSGPQNIVHPLTTSNVERHQEQFEIQNANFDKILNYAPNYLNPVDSTNPLKQYNPNFINPTNEAQIPLQVGQPKDINYPANINNTLKHYTPDLTVPAQAAQLLDLKNPNYINPTNETQIPVQVGQPKDINYPTNINNTLKHFNPDLTVPAQSGQPLDLKNPNNYTELTSDVKNKPQIPILEAQNAINPLETHQNLQSVGFLRDIDYQMSSLSQKSPTDQNSNQQIKCHNCSGGFDDGDVAITADRTTNLWHAKCFNCATCKQPLADLLYFYHKDTNNIYCGRDYSILKGIPRCLACDELIFVREYCLAEDNTFHIKHFCCFECDKPLAGNQYIMENNQPVCITCFENIKAEKCNDCLQTICPDQEGVSLQDLHWHASPECFACKKCRKSLLGNKMLLRNQNLFCSDMCFKSY